MKKQISKGLSAMIVIALMVLSVCMSKVGARVDPYTIVFNIDPNATAQHTMVVDGNHLKIDGQYVDPVPVNQGIDFGGFTVSQNGNNIEMVITWGEPVTLNFNSGNAFELFMNGNPLSVETIINSAQNVQVQDYVGQQQGGNEDIHITAQFQNTHMIAFINDVNFMDDAGGDMKDSFDNDVENAGTTNPNETNKITLIPCFGDNPVEEYTINNTVYKAGDEGVVVRPEDGGFEITVPGAETYTITGTGVEDPNRPVTIIWANPDYVPADEEDARWVSDFSIKNGYARAIAVYDENDNLVDPDQYTNPQSDEFGLKDGFGWVSIRGGYRALFEFIPDYGYQLTSIKLNEQEVDSTGVTNQFEIAIPQGGGNVHFAAEFTKIDDVLKADSETIEGGSIVLPEGSIENGTAQLKVSDVELPADKIKGFEDAAGDYSVKTFLDIDLFQVFYKGKNDDEDVWSNKIDELDKEATITLKLADGLTADDIVIVHNIHDGEEYEVIKIESYDEATNTITFKTKSFSNYAIATKGDGKKSDSPKAGDMVALFVGIVAIASAVMVWAIRNKKKND